MATPEKKKVSRLLQILEEEGFMTSTGKRYTPEGVQKKAAADKQRLTGGKTAKTGSAAESTLKKFAGKQPAPMAAPMKAAPMARAMAATMAPPMMASSMSMTMNPGGPASLGKTLTPAQRREREKAISTKEGATKTVKGVKYKYIRGEWQRIKRNGYTPG